MQAKPCPFHCSLVIAFLVAFALLVACPAPVDAGSGAGRIPPVDVKWEAWKDTDNNRREYLKQNIVADVTEALSTAGFYQHLHPACANFRKKKREAMEEFVADGGEPTELATQCGDKSELVEATKIMNTLHTACVDLTSRLLSRARAERDGVDRRRRLTGNEKKKYRKELTAAIEGSERLCANWFKCTGPCSTWKPSCACSATVIAEHQNSEVKAVHLRRQNNEKDKCREDVREKCLGPARERGLPSVETCQSLTRNCDYQTVLETLESAYPRHYAADMRRFREDRTIAYRKYE